MSMAYEGCDDTWHIFIPYIISLCQRIKMLQSGQGCMSVWTRTKRRRRNPARTIYLPSLDIYNVNLEKYFVLLYKCFWSKLHKVKLHKQIDIQQLLKLQKDFNMHVHSNKGEHQNALMSCNYCSNELYIK